MGKFLGFALLVFCALVMMNYFFTAASHAFSGGGLAFTGQSDAAGLSSVNFSFFDKNGVGWSYITQGYGHTPFSYAYPNDWHDGVDIAAAYGAPIYSPTGGTVLATGDQDDYCYHRAFGKYVAVKDGANGLVLWFAHLGSIAVTPGETITKDALVGTVGNTGFETGTHLHFSIFDASGFTMTPRDGCGPEPTGHDLNPLSYLGTIYK